MTSYFYHELALKGNSVNFYDMVIHGKGLPCKWHQHVKAWLQNPFNADMIIVRYERLKQDPLQELQKVCRFLKIERNEHYILKVIRDTSFEVMREKEIVWGWENPAWPKDKPFVRKGRVGGYLEEMPQEILEFFTDESGIILDALGCL